MNIALFFLAGVEHILIFIINKIVVTKQLGMFYIYRTRKHTCWWTSNILVLLALLSSKINAEVLPLSYLHICCLNLSNVDTSPLTSPNP